MAVKESTPISLRLPQHVHEALTQAAELYGQSKADLVRQLVWEGLKQLASDERLRLEREKDLERIRRREAREARLVQLTSIKSGDDAQECA